MRRDANGRMRQDPGGRCTNGRIRQDPGGRCTNGRIRQDPGGRCTNGRIVRELRHFHCSSRSSTGDDNRSGDCQESDAAIMTLGRLERSLAKRAD